MGGDSTNDGTLGRIALKQVRVRRSDLEARSKQGTRAKAARPRPQEGARPAENPLNRLVPYLDLFARLDNRELASLCGVTPEQAAQMRTQVDEVNRNFARYADLIDRLSEEEFIRLTQAPPKTVRFWLLCQPRTQDSTVTASDSGTYDIPSRPADPPARGGASAASPAPAAKARKPPPESEALSIDVDDDDDFDPGMALTDDDEDDDFF